MDDQSPFDVHEEPAIVSLALDFPEFFISIASFISPDIFQDMNCRLIMAHMLNYNEQFSVIPSRAILRSRLLKSLTTDVDYQSILAILDRPSDHREVPILKDVVQKWAEYKTYSLLYADESLMAFKRGDYDRLKNIVAQASKIADISRPGFWLFQQAHELFVQDNIIHYPTGFKQLDITLHGGPSPGEVFIWLAPTGVGKSVLLCNNARAGVMNDKNVLFVTFELSTLKSAMRIVGSMTKSKLDDMVPSSSKFAETQATVLGRLTEIHETHKKDIVIYELPPGECSVNHIYAIIDSLKKTRGWKPDIVIVDYLELMVGRNASRGDDDYAIQKNVSTEIRGLAKNENVVVYTATQTNRAGMTTANDDGSHINLDKSAESYGKNMPADYVVSINQSDIEYKSTPPKCRFFVAKNRNGKKFVTIEAEIDYSTMFVKER